MTDQNQNEADDSTQTPTPSFKEKLEAIRKDHSNGPITEHVERTDVGVSITAEIKRGSGTRDQDKLVTKVKAETLEEARVDMEQAKHYMRSWADDLREIQPDEVSD